MIDCYQQEPNSDCETLYIDTTVILMLDYVPKTRYLRRFLPYYSLIEVFKSIVGVVAID